MNTLNICKDDNGILEATTLVEFKKTGLKKGDTSSEAMELEAAIKSLGPVRFHDKNKSK